jgi:hypothetical protein
MEEIWKDIEDYEGLYQISNFDCVSQQMITYVLKGNHAKFLH